MLMRIVFPHSGQLYFVVMFHSPVLSIVDNFKYRYGLRFLVVL
jgi:hypothetical protein